MNKLALDFQCKCRVEDFEDLNISNYRELIENISEKENIHFDINELLKYSNITPYFIFNLFNKLKLLSKTQIDFLG